jgi:hypothetical protein
MITDLLNVYQQYGDSPTLLSILSYAEILRLSVLSPVFRSYIESLKVTTPGATPVTQEQAILAHKNSIYLWNKKPVVYTIEDPPVVDQIDLIENYVSDDVDIQTINYGNGIYVSTPTLQLYFGKNNNEGMNLLFVEEEGQRVSVVVPEEFGFIRNIPINYYEEVIPGPIHFMFSSLPDLSWDLEMYQDLPFLKSKFSVFTSEYNLSSIYELVYPLTQDQYHHLIHSDEPLDDYVDALGLSNVFSTVDELYGIYPSGKRRFFVSN